MDTYKFEECNGSQFIFEFKFSESNKKEIYTVEFQLFRKYITSDNQILGYEGSALLTPDMEVAMEACFQDDINFKGNLRLSRYGEENYIFIDALYGLNLQNHFEGLAVKCP